MQSLPQETRKSRQPTIRTDLREVMFRLREIDEPSMKLVCQKIRDAGVIGDDKDICMALRKLHSMHIIKCSHEIKLVRHGDEAGYERRQVVHWLGRPTP